MHHRVKTHVNLIRALHTLKPKYRTAILNVCTEEEINFICECIHNVLQGKIPLEQKQKSKLSKFKHLLRKILRKGNSKLRKNIIIQKGGAFLPIILGSILSGLMSSILKN